MVRTWERLRESPMPVDLAMRAEASDVGRPWMHLHVLFWNLSSARRIPPNVREPKARMESSGILLARHVLLCRVPEHDPVANNGRPICWYRAKNPTSVSFDSSQSPAWLPKKSRLAHKASQRGHRPLQGNDRTLPYKSMLRNRSEVHTCRGE